MTNLELRILSGLHRGAALPLDCAALELGGGEQADVVLADRGLAERHALLAPDAAAGWRLEALDGEVYGLLDGAPQGAVALAPGGCARLGEVWICVCAPHAAWQEAPQALPPTAGVHGLPQVAHQDGGQERGQDGTAAPVRAAPRRASGRLKRLVLLPFGMVIVLCAATAYAFTTRPAGPAPQSASAAQDRLDDPLQVPVLARPDATVVGATGMAAGDETPLTGARLRAAFERELDDAQMIERFELHLQDGRWDMRADLAGEDKERFERLLARFVARHRIAFPVQARIVPSAALLPFTIEQVLSGAQASIVTADGKRLFVGDEYRGTRLVSMKDGRLLFAGKRKIEVQW